jgi:hypothetical protein
VVPVSVSESGFLSRSEIQFSILKVLGRVNLAFQVLFAIKQEFAHQNYDFQRFTLFIDQRLMVQSAQSYLRMGRGQAQME